MKGAYIEECVITRVFLLEAGLLCLNRAHRSAMITPRIVMAKKMRIGILTAGGDSPGLNAAIRGVGKAALGFYQADLIGFRDGFRGLAEDRRMRLEKNTLAGILTVGGTILGTSRDKPHRMKVDGRMRDMTDVIVGNYKKNGLNALGCWGGAGRQKTAWR